MCGRFTRTYTWREVHDFLDLRFPSADEIGCSSDNVSPTQIVAVCRANDHGERELAPMRWGLIPSWSKDARKGLINARAETAATKPAFRSAYRLRRCAIPANAFYEWAQPQGSRKKQAWRFMLKDAGLFAFAGLWERWTADADTFDSFTILTTTPNELVAEVYDRMPVMLLAPQAKRWIGWAELSEADASALTAPLAADLMTSHPIGPRVAKSPRNAPASLFSENPPA